MATVFIPSQMQDLSGGVNRVVVAGDTLRQVIAALDEKFPGLAERLCSGDALAAGLAASIDGQFTSRGLMSRVGKDSEVHFLPAIGGG